MINIPIVTKMHTHFRIKAKRYFKRRKEKIKTQKLRLHISRRKELLNKGFYQIVLLLQKYFRAYSYR